VKGWIAIGSSHAVGVIFASGGIAVAPLSFGGIAIGLLPFGGIAMGLIAMGAISLGVWSFGGLAGGWQTDSGVGLAWNAAVGGLAFAHDFALGGIAHAAQANTEMAEQFARQSWFFRCGYFISSHGIWMIFVIPLILQGRIAARARRRRDN
jgi:hypothetical protein